MGIRQTVLLILSALAALVISQSYIGSFDIGVLMITAASGMFTSNYLASNTISDPNKNGACGSVPVDDRRFSRVLGDGHHRNNSRVH